MTTEIKLPAYDSKESATRFFKSWTSKYRVTGLEIRRWEEKKETVNYGMPNSEITPKIEEKIWAKATRYVAIVGRAGR